MSSKQLGISLWRLQEGSCGEAITVQKVFKEIRLDEIIERKSRAENQKNQGQIPGIQQHLEVGWR